MTTERGEPRCLACRPPSPCLVGAVGVIVCVSCNDIPDLAIRKFKSETDTESIVLHRDQLTPKMLGYSIFVRTCREHLLNLASNL